MSKTALQNADGEIAKMAAKLAQRAQQHRWRFLESEDYAQDYLLTQLESGTSLEEFEKTQHLHLSSRPHPGPQRRRLAQTLRFSDARSGAPSAAVTRLAATIPIAASASTTVATRAAVSSLELCPTPTLTPRTA